LAKLAARRAAERRRRQRTRLITIVVALVVAAGGLSFLGFALIHHKAKPLAKPHPTPTASASAAGVACGAKVPAAASVKKPSFGKAPSFTINRNKQYQATLPTSCGTIVMRLTPKTAPNAVNSFVFLAQHHFFDGLIFHRIAKNFVIQGGDPTGTGSGGPGYKTLDVPPKGTMYPKGTVAMAKGGNEPAGTAGSQFFIVTGDATTLPSDYAVIGVVTSGLDVASKIEALDIVGGATDGMPVQKVYIDKVTIRVL